MEICELAKLIPHEELKQKLSYGCSELEIDFLCFDECYRAVSELLPHSFTVVDLGCYQAAQCYYFTDFGKYIGVDCYDQAYKGTMIPPLRFSTSNTEHHVETIQKYLGSTTWDNSKTYFIMSAVPNKECKYLMGRYADNYLWWYPGEKPEAKGVMADKILERVNKYLSEREIDEY